MGGDATLPVGEHLHHHDSAPVAAEKTDGRQQVATWDGMGWEAARWERHKPVGTHVCDVPTVYGLSLLSGVSAMHSSLLPGAPGVYHKGGAAPSRRGRRPRRGAREAGPARSAWWACHAPAPAAGPTLRPLSGYARGNDTTHSVRQGGGACLSASTHKIIPLEHWALRATTKTWVADQAAEWRQQGSLGEASIRWRLATDTCTCHHGAG